MAKLEEKQRLGQSQADEIILINCRGEVPTRTFANARRISKRSPVKSLKETERVESPPKSLPLDELLAKALESIGVPKAESPLERRLETLSF